MRRLLILLTALLFPVHGQASAEEANVERPTIVLVHGAFAESSSWNAVIDLLKKKRFNVIAAGNPLRGVKSDAATISALVRSISGPVVLVGHSYGGPVITEVANDAPNVKTLVYVAGFSPDKGESSLSLSAKFPGSTLGDALTSVPIPDGGHDLYIRSDKFHAQFAADVSAAKARLMAATQRPVTQAALAEISGVPSWRRLPVYAIYGTADLNIPPAVMKFMAERAKSRKTVSLDGASHAVMVSHPREVSALIIEAASSK